MEHLRKNWLRHLTFWIALWFLQSLLFSTGGGLTFYMAKNVAIVSLQAIIVYTNLYGLVHLLKARRYFTYTLACVTLIYLVFAISNEVIGVSFAVFFPGMTRMIIEGYSSWWPTGFWHIISGSAPYSLVLLGSTIFHLVKTTNAQSQQAAEPTNSQEDQSSSEAHTLMLKEGKAIHRLDIRDILYVQGMKEYVSWHTSTKKLVTLHSLTKLEDTLADKGFLRTHKSFIVNTRCIEVVKYDSVEIPGKKIPVGRSYRTKVQVCFASEL